MFPTPTPPTASKGASAGNTARHALKTAGGMISAGNSFNPSAPGFQRRKTLRRRHHARKGNQTCGLGGTHHIRVEIRRDDKLAACVFHPREIAGLEHSTGADQRMVCMTRREALDALERLR